jgi:ribosomal protein L11 methyltransferase
MVTQRAVPLETVAVDVPESALETFEAALGRVCATVGFFRDDATGLWRVEGVKEVGVNDPALEAALALAAAASGAEAVVSRTPTPVEGWLARTYASFPEQHIGRRFAVRGTHLSGPATPGRITLTLDAGIAFGSGEHGSTRGCLRALERVAHRRPQQILDLGTGSGILAMAAAGLLHRRVLATDIEPWSVRVAQQNAVLNGLGPMVRARLSDGWRHPAVRTGRPYDLVFATCSRGHGHPGRSARLPGARRPGRASQAWASAAGRPSRRSLDNADPAACRLTRRPGDTQELFRRAIRCVLVASSTGNLLGRTLRSYRDFAAETAGHSQAG